MNAAHTTFNVLQEISVKLNKNVAYISEDTPERSKYYSWMPTRAIRQICYQLLKAFDMAWELFRTKKVELIFIFEHKPWYSYLLYMVCILKGKPVFFIVHGLQQTHHNSLFHKLGFNILLFLEKYFNFWPIHLEISDQHITNIIRFTKSIVIPHPLSQDVHFATKQINKIIKVGIVGMIRPDKPIQPLIDILKIYQSRADIQVFIGTAKFSLPDTLLKNNIFPIHDTTSAYDYNKFIESMHIIINNFDKDQFYFRPSGIINDSLAGGCVVIAPNFPVFAAQISTPVEVGYTYNNIREIPTLVDSAIIRIKEANIRFDQWIDYRQTDRIIDSISKQISLVLKRQ
jgi:hypothetical protein